MRKEYFSKISLPFKNKIIVLKQLSKFVFGYFTQARNPGTVEKRIANSGGRHDGTDGTDETDGTVGGWELGGRGVGIYCI